jgi:hypothetical protein
LPSRIVALLLSARHLPDCPFRRCLSQGRATREM